MTKGKPPAALFVAIALAVAATACEGKKEPEPKAQSAEDTRREAERATRLAEALKALEAAMPATEQSRQDFATLRKQAPARFHADIEELERCPIDGALKAAVEKRYPHVAGPAVVCMNSMQALLTRARATLLSSLLSGKPTTASSQRDDKVQTALVESAAATHKMATALVGLMIDYGPPDVRLSTFEAIASTLPPADSRDGEVPRALLQRSHAGENVKELKEKMAARMKELAVPLEPAQPSPTPAA